MPLENFAIDKYNPAEEDLLEYLITVADYYAPDLAHDANGTICLADSQAPRTFKYRYNHGLLSQNFSFNEYRNLVGDTLDTLNIDSEKFWYLLLFVVDYVRAGTIDAHTISPSPRAEIEQIIQFAENYSPTKLTLHVHGKNMTVSNPTTLSLIIDFCREGLQSIHPDSILSHDKLGEKQTLSNSIAISLFTQMFLYFFRQHKEFSSRRGKNNTPSCSTLFLISRLAYLAKFTYNKNYCVSDENIKAILKRHRNSPLNTVNSLY